MNGPARPAKGEGRDALIDAAIRVVARSGLRGLTLRSVAAEAGVSRGLVTYQFGSRAGLLHEAMRVAARKTVGATLEDDSADFARLREQFPRSVRDRVDVQAFQYELTLEGRREDEYRPQATELLETNLASVRAFLEGAGVAPRPGLVRLVYAALDGLALQQLLTGDAEGSREALAELEALLDGDR